MTTGTSALPASAHDTTKQPKSPVANSEGTFLCFQWNGKGRRAGEIALPRPERKQINHYGYP